MKSKWIYAGALIFGLLTSYFIYDFLAKVEKSATEAKAEEIVVVACNVPAKTLLTREMLVLKKVPVEGIHAQAFRKTEEAVGSITLTNLVEGEQLLKDKLASKDEVKNGLAYLIPPDKRAISIPVDDVSGVADLLKPGDKVDVAAVLGLVDANGKERMYSLVILQDTRILAVGKKLAEKSSGKENGQEDKRTVTLAVTVEEAQSLFLANQKGVLRLLLRSPIDDNIVATTPYQQEDFLRAGGN